MEKKIRYAVIGCGEHALRSHAVPALDMPEFELVALCDPSEHQSWNFQEALGLQGVSRYTTLALLLGRDDVDAVVIGSPDRFHAETLFHAVFAGKHVLCEKPTAVNDHDLQTLRTSLSRADEQGLVVTSCHPRRFDRPYVWIRDRLKLLTAELGAIVSLDLDFSYHKASKTGLHVGLLIDHLNHEYDLMNFLFGRTQCVARRVWDTQDRYHVAGIRQDGIAFTFQGTRLLEARRYPEYVRIRFARGTLTVDCESGDAECLSHETGNVQLLHAGPTDYPGRFGGIMRNFAASILRKADNYLDREDIANNAAIGIALTHGARWSG